MRGHALLFLLAFPFFAAALVLLFPQKRRSLTILLSFLLSLLPFGAALRLFFLFPEGSTAPFREISLPWLDPGVSFHLAVDSLSLPLILLTTLLLPITLLASWKSPGEGIKGFLSSLFLLEGALLGVFLSQNALLFYLFWEAVLIPMYFLIGKWGGERRTGAARKFLLYTMAGSVPLLAGILWSFSLYGRGSFEIALWTSAPLLPAALQKILFLLFLSAFAVKLPLFPFHTWLPDAHTEAPTAGSVFLAAVLLKMGVYGFLRLAVPLFPEAVLSFRPALIALALIGVVYGALTAFAQEDMKRLVAYSSVSHMGLIFLGLLTLTPEGYVGGLLQSVNHGLSTGALFLCVGLLYERTHTRLQREYGGTAKAMPAFNLLFLVFLLSSAGLPGLNGFTGEFPIFWALFLKSPWLAGAALTGTVVGAVYLLSLYKRVMTGPEKSLESGTRLLDLSPRELLLLLPLLLLVVWIGLYPSLLTKKMAPPSYIAPFLKEYRLPGGIR